MGGNLIFQLPIVFQRPFLEQGKRPGEHCKAKFRRTSVRPLPGQERFRGLKQYKGPELRPFDCEEGQRGRAIHMD